MTGHMQRNNSTQRRSVHCTGCNQEGHHWSIPYSELTKVIINIPRGKTVDNHPDNENSRVSLRETLEAYREYLQINSLSISFRTLRDFCGTMGWRFIPYTIERALTVCPERIAFLDPKIQQNREAGDRQRMRIAQAVLRGAMTRRWIRKNMKLLLDIKKFNIEKAERIRAYKAKAELDFAAQRSERKYNQRSSGLNRQAKKKEDDAKQPRPKRQNNGFRKELGQKWSPQTYHEFLMDIHNKSNKPADEAPLLEDIYFAVVEKTYGGSTISILKLQNGTLLDRKVYLNPRMFRDWARGKKSAKGQKVQLEAGLLCLIYIDEVVQLFSNREKDLMIQEGIVPERFGGNIETIKDQAEKLDTVFEEKFFTFEEAESDEASEVDSDEASEAESDEASEADSDEASEADSDSEDEDEAPSKLAKFIKPKAGTSKWLCDGDDSDSESESEEEPESKLPAKWSFGESDSESESEGPVREKRLSRAQRVAQKNETRKAQLAREREAKKAAARAKEAEYELEVEKKMAENFDAFLESI